jgi:hypothetical protein
MKFDDHRAGCCLTVFLACFFAVSVIFADENADQKANMKTGGSSSSAPKIQININTTRIDMGSSVTITAHASDPGGKPAAGQLVLTYVNGKRWGAHEYTDIRGRATMHLPLPNPGIAEIQAEIRGETREAQQNPQLFTGRRVPGNANVSNILKVEVLWRDVHPPKNDPDRLIGMQWEPWFTPQVAFWQLAAVVPLMGFYDSYSRDVIRQHVLWFDDLGVDFILADWSNHIWGKTHWNERTPDTNTILLGTTLLLETLADMRTEGIPVPKVVIMPGLSNGPPAAMTALNEELDWIYENYNCNPRFEGLFQDFDGKPLVVILDTGAMADPRGTAESAYRIPFIKQTIGLSESSLDSLRANMKTPVDDSHFTVRWMSTQLQTTEHQKLGFWTWMDGAIQPVVTYRGGKAEAVTVTPSFFAAQGWKGPGAYGRRGGATYIETFKAALESTPRVVMLHQFNEFAGQRDGEGYGPNKDIYVDEYNVELSDDLEPVSLTAPGYRGNGGWGYYYLNLTRALLDLYRQKTPETTVAAVARPGRGEVVTSDDLEVEWSWAGKAPESFTVSINGKIVARNITGTKTRIDLKPFAEGPIKLVLKAEGTKSRYILSYNEDSLPRETGAATYSEVDFTLKRNK